jgi:hypothetical protein
MVKVVKAEEEGKIEGVAVKKL